LFPVNGQIDGEKAIYQSAILDAKRVSKGLFDHARKVHPSFI